MRRAKIPTDPTGDSNFMVVANLWTSIPHQKDRECLALLVARVACVKQAQDDLWELLDHWVSIPPIKHRQMLLRAARILREDFEEQLASEEASQPTNGGAA